MTRRTWGEGGVAFDGSRNVWVGRLNYSENGKRLRPSVRAKTKTECLVRLRQLRQRIEDGEQGPKVDPQSVASYLFAWLDGIQVEVTTAARYLSTLKRCIFSIMWFADRKLADLSNPNAGKAAILALYADLKAAGFSDSSRRKVQATLHAAFEDARHLGRLSSNPCDLPKKLKPKYTRPDAISLTREQESALLATARGGENESLIMLALDSGARQGELFGLVWSDLLVETGRLAIDRTVKDDNGHLFVGPTKNKQKRLLLVSAETVAALLRHKQTLEASGYAGPLMFPDHIGGYLRRQNFDRREWRKTLERAADDSGLDFASVTFHTLRHTCATMLLQEGEPIAEVSARLGHSKITTTLDYYSHALPENRDRPADRFAARLASYLKEGHQEGHRQQIPPIPVTRKNARSLTGRAWNVVPRPRVELGTPGFSDLCSTS
jgi:integrase